MPDEIIGPFVVLLQKCENFCILSATIHQIPHHLRNVPGFEAYLRWQGIVAVRCRGHRGSIQDAQRCIWGTSQ